MKNRRPRRPRSRWNPPREPPPGKGRRRPKRRKADEVEASVSVATTTRILTPSKSRSRSRRNSRRRENLRRGKSRRRPRVRIPAPKNRVALPSKTRKSRRIQGVDVIKHFFSSSLTARQSKLECLFLGSLSIF